MSVSADTSFIAAIYLTEERSSATAARFAREGSLPLTPLGRLELINAMYLARFRGDMDAARTTATLAAIGDDLAAGRLIAVAWPMGAFETAERLAALHAVTLGARSLDILQVASALALGADTFLTYDRRQAALARAAGLRVRP